MKTMIVFSAMGLHLVASGIAAGESPAKKSRARAMPTYAQVIQTYPANAELCDTTGDITGGNDQGITLGPGSHFSIQKGYVVYQCYGTKLTVKAKITLEGKTYKPGTKLTVDEHLKWVKVSSWESGVEMKMETTLMKNFKDSATVAEGEAFLATVENVEKRTTRTDLADGFKLALLPKKTKGGSVRLVLTVRFGSEQDVKGKTTAAAMLPSMLMRGTRKHSFQQIKDQLDQLRAEADFGGGHSSPGVVNVSQMRVKTTRENLPAVLDLVSEILREPAFAKNELESLRKEMLAGLEKQLQDPRANGQVVLMQKLFPFAKDDVRYVPSVKESIERVRKVQAPELARMHKALWGMSAAQLAVVGDFDPEAVKAQLERDLGAWKSPSRYQRIGLPFRANAPADETINTPDNEMAFVIMGSTLPVRDDDPTYPALTMLSYVLGGSPTSRLSREGLSYGAGSRIFAHPIDVSGHFLAWAICAPQNMDKSLAAMQEEIRKLVEDGVTDKELDDAKKSYAKNWESRLADDDFVSGELAQGLFLGRTFTYWADLDDKIGKLTTADIKVAAQKFIKPDRLVLVRAGDLAKRK